MRRVALEGHVLVGHLLAADARALVDGARDGIAGDALLARLFTRRKKPGIPRRVGPPCLAATMISFRYLPVACDLRSEATSRLASNH